MQINYHSIYSSICSKTQSGNHEAYNSLFWFLYKSHFCCSTSIIFRTSMLPSYLVRRQAAKHHRWLRQVRQYLDMHCGGLWLTPPLALMVAMIKFECVTWF